MKKDLQNHYIVGKSYIVKDYIQTLDRIVECNISCKNSHKCPGRKQFSPGYSYCGRPDLHKNATFIPRYKKFPQLLKFTLLVAFELSAGKWERLRNGEDEDNVNLWIQEEYKKYNIPLIKPLDDYYKNCPLCLWSSITKTKCVDCIKHCVNLTHTKDLYIINNCFVVWSRYRDTQQGKIIIAAEFRRVADELKKEVD